MYVNKSENADAAAAAAAADKREPAVKRPPLIAQPGSAAPIMPPRRPVIRPEVVRRPTDYHATGSESEMPIGAYSEGKKLIVGRDIALSGSINACEKLVVEGRVEANISDCQEIEIAESGIFKGEAEIDVAEIRGVFEGTLIARELLMVRNTGWVKGSVRFGRLEVERGGKIEGDVRVYLPDGTDDGGTA